MTCSVEEIVAFVACFIAREKAEVGIDRHTPLLKAGLLDSFDLVTLATELSRAFGPVFRPKDLLPEDFESANTLWLRISQLIETQSALSAKQPASSRKSPWWRWGGSR